MKKAAFVLALVMLMTCMAGCGKVEGEASVQSVSMICGLGSVGLADRFAGIVSPLGETKIKKDDSMAVSDIRVKVGDTNGAGDTFFGAALSKLVREDLSKLTLARLTEIASFANKAASITTSRHGAIPAMPRLEEVE